MWLLSHFSTVKLYVKQPVYMEEILTQAFVFTWHRVYLAQKAQSPYLGDLDKSFNFYTRYSVPCLFWFINNT